MPLTRPGKGHSSPHSFLNKLDSFYVKTWYEYCTLWQSFGHLHSAPSFEDGATPLDIERRKQSRDFQ